MEVLKKSENVFLGRVELLLKVPHSGKPTPTREYLKSEVAKKFKVTPEKVNIRHIFSQRNKDYSIAKTFIPLSKK